MNGILTTAQAAEILQVTEEYVRRLLRKRKLAGFKLGDNWRVKSEDLDAFINSRVVGVAGAEPSKIEALSRESGADSHPADPPAGEK